MKRLMTAVFLALLTLTSATYVDARRTYTIEELEAMKKAGKLRGNERFAIIVVEDGSGLTGSSTESGLTGRKTEKAYLIPADDNSHSSKAVRQGVSEAIAYDKVTTTRYLTTMAREYYGNLDFWPFIYEENKEKLGDPDRTTPGTMVVVPDLKKYGVNPKNQADIEKARRMGKEIYARYGKQY